MNHVMKKRGVPDIASGTPPRSVCGILCGQRKSAKLHRFQKLQKSKENTRNPKISGVILELLTRFELVTSSLPTTVEPSSPCCIRLCGVFLSKKDKVAACLFHCFHPHVSPCGSRCGSSGNFCIKEAADRLRRHISFYRFSLIIDSGNLLNESLLLPAGFRPRHAELSAHRKKSVIPQSVFFRFMREVPLRVFHCQPSSK